MGDLPADILRLIHNLLPLFDYARFPSVCTSWRRAAAENPRPPAADTIPWLLVQNINEGEDPTLTAITLSPDNDDNDPLQAKVYRFPVPKEIQGHRFASAFDDSTILIEKEEEDIGGGIVQVVNPFSPSWTPLGGFPYRTPRMETRNTIFKVVASHDFAVAIAGNNRGLIYNKLSGPSSCNIRWKRLYSFINHYFVDLIYSSRDGLFYAVREFAMFVMTLDLSPSRRRPKMRDVTFNLPPDSLLPTDGEHHIEIRRLHDVSLVDSPHGVFIVRWMYRVKTGAKNTREVYVYKLCDKEWTAVRSLDDCAFFISTGRSMALSAAGLPPQMRNRIYLPQDAVTSDNFWFEGYDDAADHNWVYNLEDRSWDHYCSPDVHGYQWIMPRLSRKR